MSRAAFTLDVRAGFLLFRDPVPEENHQLSVDRAPVLPPARPFLRDVHHGEIEHFEKAVVGGKDGFCFGHFPKLAVEALDGVGGVDQPPHLLRILEIGAEIRPILPPGLRDFGVFLIPAFSEDVQSVQSGLFIYCRIDHLQICHQGFQILVGDIFAGVAQLVDDAVLDFRFGEYRLNRSGKAGQIIRTGDENILHAPVPQAVQHGRPELGALVFSDPHSENVLLAVQIDAYGDVHGFLYDLHLAAYMVL